MAKIICTPDMRRQVAAICEDHMQGNSELPHDPALNPIENEISRNARADKRACDDWLVNEITAPRDFTMQLNVPLEDVELVTAQALDAMDDVKREFDRRDGELGRNALHTSQHLRALEMGSGGARDADKLRRDAFRRTLVYGLIEAVVASVLVFVSGYFEGGLIAALLFAGFVPVVTLAAGWAVGDVLLRIIVQRIQSQQRDLKFYLAFLGVVFLTAMVGLLTYLFATFRSSLEDAPSYMLPGILLMGLLIYASTALKWFRAPPANDEIKLAKRRLAELEHDIEANFVTQLAAVDKIDADAHDRLDDLVDDTEPRVQDLYLAVRDVEHANARYLSALGETCHAHEVVTNQLRAQVRDTVPLSNPIPAYFSQPAVLAHLFTPSFDLKAFQADAAGKATRFAALKTAVAKAHGVVEAARVSARQAIYAKKQTPISNLTPLTPVALATEEAD